MASRSRRPAGHRRISRRTALACGAVVVAGAAGGAALTLAGDSDPPPTRAIPGPSHDSTASPSPAPSKHTSKSTSKSPSRKPSAKPRPTRPSPPPRPRTVPFAPYVDTSLSPPFDLTAAARSTGVRNFTLAFIKPAGGCTPRLGSSTLGEDPVAAKTGALRAAGGDVRVSFGGQSGAELARDCSSVTDLAAAYAKVIDAYELKKVDFDVEAGALSDGAANDRRNRAVAELQKSHPGLDVSFTLPALPRGLTPDGLSLLRNAESHGVDIGAVNAMAMNYGSSPAPNPDGRMGKYAIDAAEATHAQLRKIIGGSDADVWKRVAVTPMIGVNDIEEEVFTVEDATEVGEFARSKGMAWVSMWSATRDKACPDGSGGPAAATCSGVGQSANAFSKAFAAGLR